MKSIRLAFAALACCAAFVPTAHAQWLGQDYATYGAPLSSFGATNFLNLSVLNDAKSGATQDRMSTLAPAVGRSTTAAELAARYPAAQRAQLTKVFEDSLSGFEKVSDHLRQPRDDMAVALAAFLVGNYCALHGQDLPSDEDFVALVHRLHASLVASPAFKQATPAHKRQAYEQLAMVGMFMNTARMALQQTPNPQAEGHFRDSAKANLEQLLKVPADRIEIRGGQIALR